MNSNLTSPLPPDAPNPPADRPKSGEVVIPAEAIFAGRTEVWIDLNGERYRLRITRRQKLILQK